MARKTIEYIFDFGAPNGYLAWYPLKDIAARTGARLEVTPVFLGGMHKLTGNAPPMVRDAGVKGKVAYAALEFQRLLDRHGMDRRG
jgi:2-hydroxychromene-2-carboxylate isomerase